MPPKRPSLHLLSRTPRPSVSAEQSGTPFSWRISLIAVVALVICTMLLIPEKGTVPRLTVGDTPLTDVTAPRNLSVLDSRATEAARARARARVPVVYDISPAETDRLEARIRDVFTAIRTTRFEVASQAGDGDHSVDALLKDRLGITLPERLQGTSPRHFTRRLEGELVSTLRLYLERGILADRDDVPGGPGTEVLVRTVGERREGYLKLDTIPDLAAVREAMSQAALQAYPRNPVARDLLTTLGRDLLFANMVENPHETRLRQDAEADRVKPLFFQVKKGEVIVPAGSQVLHVHQEILETAAATGHATLTRRLVGVALLCALIFHVFYLDLKGIRSRVLTDPTRALLTGLILVGTLALCRLTLFLLGAFAERFESIGTATIPLALPVAAGAMLMTLLLSVRTALVFAMIASILMGLMVPDVPLFTLYGFVTSLVGVFAVTGCERRTQLIRAGIWVGFVSTGVAAGIDLHQTAEWVPARLYDLPFAFAGGILCAAVVSAVLPVMETVFNVPTNIRLLELSDLNHPLLRKLLERAPGTYHHSMIMSNMAEQAAKAVGENTLLARVGCYYHDIGKMAKPEYFIENRWGGEDNLHDDLEPTMSRLILVSHVKEGIELARSHGLPEEIIDMIPQHHGTRLINYFYVKAKASHGPEAPPPEEETFRYPGPRPQTKVAGIIMLADTVEASSRVLDDPSPARIATLVDKVVSTIYLDQQLDECELTLKDLRRISDAFVKTLTGTFHHRIRYPDMHIPPGPADAGTPDQSSTALSG